MSNGSSSLSLDHHHHNNNISPSDDHLCYVHCNLCNTVLAVSVPGSSLLKTVTVRCGHCSSLLPVNMRALLIPPPSPATVSPPHNLLGYYSTGANPSPNFSLSNHPNGAADTNYMATMSSSSGSVNDLPRPPMANKPPEKRQRVPSAYNRFIKEEIQRIKAGNPDIAHREAFSAAAKNWAHFPHIHFGLMSEQNAKRTSIMRPHPQGDTGVGMNVRMKDGLFAASTTFGVSPY